MAEKVKEHILKDKPADAEVATGWGDSPMWQGEGINLTTGKTMVNLKYRVSWRIKKKDGSLAKNLTRRECSVFMEYCPFCGTKLRDEK
ncbi:hypothetical protein WKH53_14495 [Pantoea agglomerans]|uniref:hypothetical protein n=1 Tax=Enterobacter agglomerans TaxID=549 RepID=UPI003C7D42B8